MFLEAIFLVTEIMMVILKILAMRHPRRLVLSGCLSALIVSLFFANFLFYLAFTRLIQSNIYGFTGDLYSLEMFSIEGHDYSFGRCWLGCSKFGENFDPVWNNIELQALYITIW